MIAVFTLLGNMVDHLGESSSGGGGGSGESVLRATRIIFLWQLFISGEE